MTATASRDEAGLRRRGLRLASFIIVRDVIEGIVAVTAGLLAGSIARVGFGIDSAIEVFAASVVVWQLRGGGKDRRRVALRLIAPTFFLLAAYVAYEAIGDLLTGAIADPSPLGLGLNVVALLVMVPVAIMQGRTGRALGNDVLIAEEQETFISNASRSACCSAWVPTRSSAGGGPTPSPPSPSPSSPSTRVGRPGGRRAREGPAGRRTVATVVGGFVT